MAEYDEIKLKELRKDIFLTGYHGGMAHFASCFSCLEILYTLYLKSVLRYDSKDPDWEERDRLVLSKGHAGLALYAVMSEAGFLSREKFHSYLSEGSSIGGEPCMRDLKGIEASTGSLGHGLLVGVGMAMAQKMNHSDAKTYVILGDGEIEEGTVWEAAMMASAQQLDNFTAILDCNEIQKMDSVVEIIGTNNWRCKWESFGWDVIEVDGHDVADLKAKLIAVNEIGKPRFVIAHTIKGKGVSIMENNPNWHFKLPNKRELKVFMKELNVTEEELRR